MTIKIWNTGYSRGRPRTGEIRPPSKNAISFTNFVKNKVARDPSYKAVLAKRQSDWRARNLERSNEISRAAYRRKRTARLAQESA